MPLNVNKQLSNSEGLLEIIVFSGLGHDIVVRPTVHGEPLLTVQPFYYLDQLESVAVISYKDDEEPLPEQEMEYIIDNYLFEYSKFNQESRASTKVMEGKYWAYDESDMYALYDQRSTMALVLDALNDPSVHTIKSLAPEDNVDFNDWCVIRNYSDDVFYSYVSSMRKFIDMKVYVEVSPTSERDGYIGRARLVKCEGCLIDYYQAQEIDTITIHHIKNGNDYYEIKSKSCESTTKRIPVKRVSLTKKYNPTLLSFYFSALRESNPLLSFVSYYNVLEYYFEEAPSIVGRSANIEREQIKCVIQMLADDIEIKKFFDNLNDEHKIILSSDIATSSGVNIQKLSLTALSFDELGQWLYDIRCAIIHSKKTRKGNRTAIFEPYSAQVEGISPIIPIMKWLAILCIEKDYELNSV